MPRSRKRKMATNPFDCLSNEMIEQVFRNLEIEDMKSARLVCTGFKNSVDNMIYFSIPLTNETLPLLEDKDYRPKEVRVILNQLNIPGKLSKRLERTFAAATNLHFVTEGNSRASTTYWTTGGWDLRNSFFVDAVDGQGVQRVLKACQHFVERIGFDLRFMGQYSITSVMNVSRLQFPLLSSIELKTFGSGVGVETAILRLKTPCLRSLSIERAESQCQYRDSCIYIAMLECLVHHKETLRSLKLIRMLTSDNNTTSYHEQCGELLDSLAELNLESLELYHHRRALDSWLAAEQLLKHSNSLKILKVTTDCIHLTNLTSDLILRNRSSLSTLELDIKPPAPFNFELLASLTACTHLSISCPEFKTLGFFPTGLMHLTSNAPLGPEWYVPENTRNWFTRLRSLTLGSRAFLSLRINVFCDGFFGDPTQRTALTTLTLQKKWVWEHYPNLNLTEHLTEEYKVEVKPDVIRIRLD